MPRSVILYTGPWTDLPLETLAAKAAEWGYHGLELACWGDHFQVQRAASEDDYCPRLLDLASRHDLQLPVLSMHRVGQALCDPIDDRHRDLLPDYVWGQGDSEEVAERSAEEMVTAVQAAEKLGATVLSGFTGSPLWSYVAGWPAPSPETIADGYRLFAERMQPILDVCRDCGIRFALEVHPGQVAFDLDTAEMALDAVDGREELGFTFDPSHFHWQGIDPVEFLRRFPDRIYHVHIKDAVIKLNGRNGLLNGYWPSGDPRRGWDFRAPGHGGIDWESIIRGLNQIHYDGPLSVEFKDADMDREYGAEEACKFVRRLDFPRAESPSA